MNQRTQWIAAALLAAGGSFGTHAQVPGEDPVVLPGKLRIDMLPGAPAPKSGGLEQTGMSAGLRARVARFEAKAYSADSTGVVTNNDVVNSVQADGMAKTCIQDVGSVTSTSSSGVKVGPGQQSTQIVVLRGDLVNICR